MIKPKNKYIRFIENSILFIAIVFIMDFTIGNILRHFYFTQKSGGNYHLTYSIDSTEAEIIILGSSRACHHYIPKIMEDSLNLACFNSGRDGNYTLFSYAIYKSIIERYEPEIVLMDLNPNELFTDPKGYDYLASLLPYYKTKKEIQSIIHLKSEFEKLKLLSGIYPFNSKLLQICWGNLQKEDINVLKGYMPLFGNLADTVIAFSKEINQEIDPNIIKVLDTFASECKTRHIQLIFIQSPRYKIVSQETIVSVISELAAKNNAEFWNYVNDKMFLKPEYFKDYAHMNDLGASEFTKAIAGRIKRGYILADHLHLK